MGRELANAHYIFNLSSVAILFYLSCLGSSNSAILLCTFSYSAYYIVYSFALHILLQYILFYTLLYSIHFFTLSTYLLWSAYCLTLCPILLSAFFYSIYCSTLWIHSSLDFGLLYIFIFSVQFSTLYITTYSVI